jgi:ABC-type transport system involved in cytochrome c biogenesis permease subunit
MFILVLSFGFYLFSLIKRQFLYLALALQIIYFGMRGLELERLPLVGPHDTLAFLSASLASFSIVFVRHLKEPSKFIGISALISAIFTVFSLTSKQYNAPLPPVLKTFWFETHVVLAFLSYALFAISAICGYLFLRNQESYLDSLQYKASLIGYSFFSISMIFGGIWAYLAWGTYWLWTPKELWTSILWIFYSLYLHLRLRSRWAGKPMAILSIAGFAIVLFTYLGVSLLMKSSHSF